MTLIILAVLAGIGLIGGIVALATSNSGSSNSNNDTEITTTNEKDNQTTQDIYRAPARTMYLNTAPVSQIPVQAPIVKEPYDDSGVKKEISNLKGEITSLNSMLSTQQQIKKCEEENAKLEKESKALEDTLNSKKENGLNEFLQELNKLQNATYVDQDVKEIFKAIIDIKKANVSQLDKDKILLITDNLSNNNTFVANHNNNAFEKAIMTLDCNNNSFYNPSKTKIDILKESLTTILNSNEPDKLVKAVDDIIIQFSKDNQGQDTTKLIHNSVDNDDTSLEGVFSQNGTIHGLNNQTRVCFLALCHKLHAVQCKIYKRTIDDNNNQANKNKLSNRSIKNKFLYDDTHYNGANNPNDTPNNSKFAEVLQQVCQKNKKIKQTKEFVKNNEDKSIKVLNDKLVAQFQSLNNETDPVKQTDIKNNIKNLIVKELNSVSSDKKTTVPHTSDRRKMWNYLKSIGIELINIPAGVAATATTAETDISAITNANISGLDKCVLKDKDICKSISTIMSNNLKIEENKKKIAQLSKNVSPNL